MLSKKLILFCLSLFLSIGAFAHAVLDIMPEPQPYDVTAYTGNTSNKSVKQRTFIKERGGRKDFFSTEFYDILGRTTGISYTSGKKTPDVSYEYYPGQNMSIWRTEGKDKSITVHKTVYRGPGDEPPLFTESATTLKGDTLSINNARFEYNADGLLLKRQDFLKHKVYATKTYRYDQKDLVWAEVRSPYSPTYNAVKFSYDNNHHVIAATDYFFRPGKTDTVASFFYTYDKDKLIAERDIDPSDPKKYISISYTYDDNGRISSMVSKEDTLYRQTTFQYTGKLLTKVTVKANDPYKLGKGYYTTSPNALTKMPMTNEFTYVYDDKGYLIKLTEVLNGVMLSALTYEMEYY